jgi:competence protein ComEA
MLERLQQYRAYIAITLINVILMGAFTVFQRLPEPEAIEIITPTPGVPADVTAPTVAVPTPTIAPIYVHVLGAVARPGVYALAADSRCIEAVEAAGGLTADADEERINLADRLRDGQQLYVPRLGTPAPALPTASVPDEPSGVAAQPGESRLVNLNTALAAELETLPGIGPVYAERIIAYREEHGPFDDPAEIMEVRGIGLSCFETIQDRITIE